MKITVAYKKKVYWGKGCGRFGNSLMSYKKYLFII